jgi:hypothetical protein
LELEYLQPESIQLVQPLELEYLQPESIQLVQPLELEYLQPESIQLEQLLVTITILNTDFENSFMRYWISTGATFGTGIPST